MANGISKLQLFIDLKNKLKLGLDQAKDQVSKATGDMQGKLNAFKKSNIQAFSAIEERIPGVGSAMGMIVNPYVAVAAAAVATAAAIYKCTDMAVQWRNGMAEANVTAGLTQTELDKLSDKLLEIGGRNVVPLEQIPLAFNKIISAGLDVNTALDALEPTLRAAKAGFADLETTADAAVSVMNSSGRGVNEVYDVLFQTVIAGKANFKDIAQYLPKIIPMAKNAGLALGETAGAWAFLTAQGQTAERATTLSQNAYKALADPDRIASFKKMGLSIYDAKGKIKPLVDIIDLLNTKTAGLSDLSRANFFGKLGMDSEAASFFAAATQNADKFRKIIDDVTNSQGALGRAYIASLSPMDGWKTVQNAIKEQMIKIGNIFLPIVSQIGVRILEVITYVKNLWKTSEIFRDTIAGLGNIFSVAFNIATAGIRIFINGWRLVYEAVSYVATKIFGVTDGFKDMYSKVRPYLMWISDMVKQIGGIMYDVFTLNFFDLKDKIANFKMPDMADIKHRIEVDNKTSGYFAGVPNGEKPKPTGVNPLAVDAKSIAGGSQTKSITINIDSFIKGFSPTHQSVNGMSKDELERWVTEMFLRVVRSAETTM